MMVNNKFKNIKSFFTNAESTWWDWLLIKVKENYILPP